MSTWYDFDNAPDPADMVDQNGPWDASRCEMLGHWAQVVVAVDWNSAGLSIVPVVERLGAAVIDVIADTTPHYRTGAPLPRYRIVFDASKVRNTEAAGFAYSAGFVSHITQWKDIT